MRAGINMFWARLTLILARAVKGAEMLILLLRDLPVNFAFWSHLQYSEQNVIICSQSVAVKVSFRVANARLVSFRG